MYSIFYLSWHKPVAGITVKLNETIVNFTLRLGVEIIINNMVGTKISVHLGEVFT